MQEMKPEDLQLLGLETGADVAAVEKAFEFYSRRHLADAKLGLLTPEDEAKVVEVNAAYSRLIGKGDSVQHRTTAEKGKWYVGFNKQSFENFFYLFKLQFFGALAGLVIISLLIYSFATRTEYQFEVAYWGNTTAVQDDFSALIKKSSSSIQNVQYFDYKIQSNDLTTQFTAYSLAILDSIVLDKTSYVKFASDGYFLSLDELAVEVGLDLNKLQDQILVSQKSADKVPHLYGIDVSKIKAFKKVFYVPGTILTIPTNTKDLEPGKKFMIEIMKIVAANQ